MNVKLSQIFKIYKVTLHYNSLLEANVVLLVLNVLNYHAYLLSILTLLSTILINTYNSKFYVIKIYINTINNF